MTTLTQFAVFSSGSYPGCVHRMVEYLFFFILIGSVAALFARQRLKRLARQQELQRAELQSLAYRLAAAERAITDLKLDRTRWATAPSADSPLADVIEFRQGESASPAPEATSGPAGGTIESRVAAATAAEALWSPALPRAEAIADEAPEAAAATCAVDAPSTDPTPKSTVDTPTETAKPSISAEPPGPPPPSPPWWSGGWRSFDWESLVGVRLFSYVAGVALLLAAVFFLRYSIDQGWLGPPVRLAIGILVGIALLGLGEWKGRDYRVTADALEAAGIGILLLSGLARSTR